MLNAQYIYIKDQSKIDFLKHKTKEVKIPFVNQQINHILTDLLDTFSKRSKQLEYEFTRFI